MNKVGAELVHLFLIIYIDDWLINFRPEHDGEVGKDPIMVHIDQIEAWFIKLSKAGLALKAKKTALLVNRVTFLGHVIDSEGMRMDDKKVEKITSAKAPKTRTALRSWLGMVNFYRQYLKNVSKTLSPLYDLTVKEGPERINITPGSPAHDAFERIKIALTTEPVMLFHPDFNKKFTIEFRLGRNPSPTR